MPTEKELPTYRSSISPVTTEMETYQVVKNRNKLIVPIDGEHIGN